MPELYAIKYLDIFIVLGYLATYKEAYEKLVDIGIKLGGGRPFQLVKVEMNGIQMITHG